MRNLITSLLILCLGCSGPFDGSNLSSFAPALKAFGDELCTLSLVNFEACVSDCELCGCLSECVDMYIYEQAVSCSTSADCEMFALNNFYTCEDRAAGSCEVCEAALEIELEGCKE